MYAGTEVGNVEYWNEPRLVVGVHARGTVTVTPVRGMFSLSELVLLVPVAVIPVVTTVPVETVLNEVVLVLESRPAVYCEKVAYLLDDDAA